MGRDLSHLTFLRLHVWQVYGINCCGADMPFSVSPFFEGAGASGRSDDKPGAVAILVCQVKLQHTANLDWSPILMSQPLRARLGASLIDGLERLPSARWMLRYLYDYADDLSDAADG